jgi:hypothetical protein
VLGLRHLEQANEATVRRSASDHTLMHAAAVVGECSAVRHGIAAADCCRSAVACKNTSHGAQCCARQISVLLSLANVSFGNSVAAAGAATE